MQISERLKTVASFVTEGSRVADIGTDHAYVPICLVTEGRSPCALAIDVREGPLMRATEHIRESGLQDRIAVRLSDGLSSYRQGEADSIVIAGMGGALTVHILSEGVKKLEGVRELILSPQSELFLVREWLRENGFRTERETMLCEEEKYYTIIKAVPGKETADSLAADRYGGYLLKNRQPVLKEFLLGERETLLKILASLPPGEHAGRRKELEDRLLLAEEALSYYEM